MEKNKVSTDVYMSFMDQVNEKTTQALLNVIGQYTSKGVEYIHLLLSTTGGSVVAGIDIYNKLRALPITLTTYNTGSINSVGNLLYLAGEKRYAVPSCSFMFHGVGINVGQNQRLEEKNLRDQLSSIQRDQERLAKILEERCNNIDATEARNLFLEAAFITPVQAKDMGLVHEVREVRIPKGVPFLSLVFKS